MPLSERTPLQARRLAADDLLFHEGIRAVGIKRILETSQTPIMSLYRNFGSMDVLAAAYLERRGERPRSCIATPRVHRTPARRPRP